MNTGVPHGGANTDQEVESSVSEPANGQQINAGQLPKIIKFDSLARCGEEIWIENNGQIYRLRRTKQGKLILTK